MVSKKVVLTNPTGLHLRPAGMFCEEAMNYKSKITFSYGAGGGGEANAKSILSILGACIRPGDEITLKCDGPDENEALEALVKLILDGLGEAIET